MSYNRRNFLQKFSGVAGLTAASGLINPLIARQIEKALNRVSGYTADELARDEAFWYTIQQAYTVNPNIINLNNGGVSPQPKVVQEAVEHFNRLSNNAPSYYMWRELDKGREPLRRSLAQLAGCSAEELAINRNSSEALETIIFGLRLKAGDEVVLSKQDYPNMINAWKQRAHRDGIVLKWIDLPLPSEDEQLLTKAYTDAFSARTKVVHITHVINWNGQLLPVRRIADIAHEQDIEVLVDAAHSFAQFDYKISDLNCDYWGTSLHKWLCAPFGSGLLWVRQGKIKNLYPLFAGPEPESEDIRKFEHLGTRSFAIEQAIGQAVQFHEMIGSERKQQRLWYLKNYWVERVKDLPGIQLKSPLSPSFSGAICMVNFEGRKPAELDSFLFRNYKIHTVGINWEDLTGVRITPNVYTLTKDLDVLVEAITEFAKS